MSMKKVAAAFACLGITLALNAPANAVGPRDRGREVQERKEELIRRARALAAANQRKVLCLASFARLALPFSDGRKAYGACIQEAKNCASHWPASALKRNGCGHAVACNRFMPRPATQGPARGQGYEAKQSGHECDPWATPIVTKVAPAPIKKVAPRPTTRYRSPAGR